MTAEGDVTVLTGATGFLGSLTLERLIARGARVVALVRAADRAGARRRLRALAKRTWGDEQIVAGVEAVAADLERDGLGLAPREYDALAERTDAIVHCAASVRFDLALAQAESINVAGTERVLQFAERARARGGRGRLVHVSTAYVHGRMSSMGLESGPVATPEFRNTYELTKHRAEQAVRGLSGAAIVRPSIVVGDSLTGWTSSFSTVYMPLRALLSGALKVVPASAEAIVDLIPVDQVVDVICGLLDEPSLSGTFQAVSGSMAPTIEQLARLSYSHVGLPMTCCVPSAVEEMGIYAPYVDVHAPFEFGRAGELGMRRTPADELVPRMLDYALGADWGRKPELRAHPLTAAPARSIA